MGMSHQSIIANHQLKLAWSLLHLDETGPPIARVQDAVCSYFGISKRELLLPRREPQIVNRRSIAMYLCKKLTGKSFPQIGIAFKRHHTSVMDGVRRAEQLIESNEFVACAVDEIESILTRDSQEPQCPNQQ